MIISVHVPKTGGSSFGKALKDHFGESFLRYGDGLIQERGKRCKSDLQRAIDAFDYPERFASYGAIHGHFRPFVFLPFSKKVDVNFSVWLRDPFERMASHYRFWKMIKNPVEPHVREFAESDLTFEEFCFQDRYRNFLSQYLCFFPMHNFDFIGCLEHYAEDLQRFSRQFIGAELQCLHRNKSVGAEVDTGLKEKFAEYHAIDYQLYEYAMKLRQQQLEKMQ